MSHFPSNSVGSNAYVPVSQHGDHFHSGPQYNQHGHNDSRNPGFPLPPVRRDLEKTIMNTEQQGNRGSQGRNFPSNSMSGQSFRNTNVEVADATSKWISVLDTVPSLFTHAAVSVNDHLLVYGGFSGYFDKNAILLLHTAKKSQMPPNPHFFEIKVRGDIPENKERVGMVAIGKFVYMFGGYARIGDAYFSSMHMFDIECLTCTVIAPHGDLPSARCGHCCVAVGDFMYVFGGRVKGAGSGFGNQAVEYRNDMYQFNTVNHTWRQLQTYGHPPLARAMAAAAVVGRKIYVFGGAMSTGIKDTTAFCDLYEFNVDTNEWNEVTTTSMLPIPCYGHSLTYIGNNKLLLFGGKGFSVSNQLRIFDLGTKEWKEYVFGGNRLLKRWGHTATLHHGNMLILYGGKGDDLNVYYNSIEIIDLEKELIELKPEDIAKKNLEEEEDIQAWSRKSLEYLQIDIEELSSLLGLVVQGVVHEQGESEFLLQAMKEAQETQQIIQEKAKKYQL